MKEVYAENPISAHPQSEYTSECMSAPAQAMRLDNWRLVLRHFSFQRVLKPGRMCMVILANGHSHQNQNDARN